MIHFQKQNIFTYNFIFTYNTKVKPNNLKKALQFVMKILQLKRVLFVKL